MSPERIIRYTIGLLDSSGKVCYNVLNAGQEARAILTTERVKTMNAMMNKPVLTAVSLYAFEYQQYNFFLQQEEESCFVLRTEHCGVCSAALTG